MARLKPFFTYFGGKWRAAPRYPSPLHDVIVEPFAGSAGYSMLYPDHAVVLADLDAHITTTWRYLITASEDEVVALPDLEPGQRVADLTHLSAGARYLIGWWLNRAGERPRSVPSSWMRTGLYPTRFWGPEIRERIASQLYAIRHWSVIHTDYRALRNSPATWFVDPPYQVAGRRYRYNNRTLDYAALGAWCQSLAGQVIVCENNGATWLPFQHLGVLNATVGSSHEVSWTSTPQPTANTEEIPTA